jgi:hypothetical protein
MFVNAYLYEDAYQLLYVGDRLKCCSKENKPMDTRMIKIHKGVDNSVQFTVKDKDYKRIPVDHMNVGAKFVNLENQEVVLEKRLATGTCTGELCLNVLEGDLVNLSVGFYDMVLVQEKPIYGEAPETAKYLPFYTDLADNIVYKVEITNQGYSVPMESVVLDPDTWVPLNAQEEPYTLYSSAVSANAIRNHKNSIHTFSVTATNFSGELVVLGTLDPTPPTDILQYFVVDLGPGISSITMEDYTGTTAFTIQTNLCWVKFKLIYDPDLDIDDNGSISKIEWRS